MKLKLLFITLLCMQQLALAQTYIVSQNGTVKNVNGNIQQRNTVAYNYYNNYYAQNYVDNKIVNNGGINNIEIVMDFSSSMRLWVEEAKNTMAFILNQIPKTTKVGFRVFGQQIDTKTANVCTASRQVASVAPVNYNSLIYGMNSAEIGMLTPLVYALRKTVTNDFTNIPTSERKKIVLITDGMETCGEDPCAFIKNLNRKDITIDVVLISSGSKELVCLAQETGGNVYTLENLSDFSTVVAQSITTNNKSNIQQKQYIQSYEFVRD